MPDMNPTASAQDPAAMQDSTPPELTKALEMTMQGLSKAYMIVHKMEPDGPLCQAVMSVQKAVAEVASNAGMPGDPSMMSADPGMDPMAMGGESPAEDAQDPMGPGGPEGPLDAQDPMDSGAMPPGSSIADAAGATQTMMQDAAKRRQAKG